MTFFRSETSSEIGEQNAELNRLEKLPDKLFNTILRLKISTRRQCPPSIRSGT